MSGLAGASTPVESEPLVDDLAGQVEDCRVVVEDEFGVGGQEDRVELEGEPVGVFPGGKLVLLERGGGEGAEHGRETSLDGGDPFLDRPGMGALLDQVEAGAGKLLRGRHITPRPPGHAGLPALRAARTDGS